MKKIIKLLIKESICITLLMFFNGFYTPAKSQTIDDSASLLDPCSRLPFPDQIDLMKPLPNNLVECYPQLGDINTRFSLLINNVAKKANALAIGNQRDSRINSITFSTSQNIIEVKGFVTSKQVTTIPGFDHNLVTTATRVTCVFDHHGCVSHPILTTVTKHEPAHDVIAYAVTANYDYTFNIIDGKWNIRLNFPNRIGNVSFDASAIAAIFNGEVPNIQQLLQTVDFGIEPITTETKNLADDAVNALKNQYPYSAIYVSSSDFERSISGITGISDIVESVGSFGILTPEVVSSHEEIIAKEYANFSAWLIEQGTSISLDSFKQLLTTGRIANSNSFSLELVRINATITTAKCWKNHCFSLPDNPQFGFAIVLNP